MSSEYIKAGHKWLSQQSPLTSGVNFWQWFEDNEKLSYKTVCYSILNYRDKKTPKALAFQLSNSDGIYQEIYEHFFDPKESPWKLVLPQVEIHRDKELITGVVCTNEISAQGLINLLIACRSLQEFSYLNLLNTFRLQSLNIYEAFYLCNIFNNGVNINKLSLRSYDSGHICFYITSQDKTNVLKYLSGTPTLREHGFGSNLNYAPCNIMWTNKPQGKASTFFEHFKKKHSTPRAKPYSFRTSSAHTITAQQAAEIYLKWKETLQ